MSVNIYPSKKKRSGIGFDLAGVFLWFCIVKTERFLRLMFSMFISGSQHRTTMTKGERNAGEHKKRQDAHREAELLASNLSIEGFR
jgi:hypothetical protein